MMGGLAGFISWLNIYRDGSKKQVDVTCNKKDIPNLIIFN